MSNATKKVTRFRFAPIHTKIVTRIGDAALTGTAWDAGEAHKRTAREWQALEGLVTNGYVAQAHGTPQEEAWSGTRRYKLTLKGVAEVANLVRMVLKAKMQSDRATAIFKSDVDHDGRHQRWALADTEWRAANRRADALADKLREMRRHQFIVLAATSGEVEEMAATWKRTADEYAEEAFFELGKAQTLAAITQEDRDAWEFAHQRAREEVTVTDSDVAALCDVPFLSPDEHAQMTEAYREGPPTLTASEDEKEREGERVETAGEQSIAEVES